MLNKIKTRFIHNPESFFEKTFINISPNEIRSEAILLLLQELGELFEESNKTLVIELSEIFTREDFVELDKLISTISMGIRNNKVAWKGVPGMCEVCGLRKATVNLDLKYGSHRECRICWDD